MMRLTPGWQLAVSLSFLGFTVVSAETIQVLGTKVITASEEPYSGWSTVMRRANGELWTVWSGGRDAHVCPMGQVRAISSRDDGATWTYPRVLLDTAMDDRDAGALVTAKGTLLITTFTSLAWEERGLLEKQTPERQVRWKGVRDRLSPEERKAALGEWVIRSTDGGMSWSPVIATIVNSPHGPTQLKDGRLLYVGKQLWAKEHRIGAAESKDDGLTWTWLSEIPGRPGDDVATKYHELHAVETDDGRIVAQIRHEGKVDTNWTLQTESADGGKTWTIPRPITFGIPSQLLKLRDGRLLMTYGHRRKPFGNQARMSTDQGRTWSEPMIISGDGAAGDLGYPSTVELADGTLLTVWYENMKDLGKAVLRQAKWKISK
ncbi:MAG: exo-alpha-sialidase [Opitutales bacterium]|nr:MAG: exo-alpha-sialidase [Opitutales bacterium]